VHQVDIVLFDFDYTLADSSDGIVACCELALDEMGCPRPPAQTVRRTIGWTLEEMFLHFTGEPSPERAAEFRTRYVTHADRIMLRHTRVYPWLARLIAELTDSGHRLGVVSTKYGYRIAQALELADINGAFATIVGSDRVQRSKPAPDGLELALAELESTPRHALYVGDSTTDARAAEAAGVGFVGVLTGVTPRQELEQLPHRAILHSAEQLPAWLSSEGE
jgi:phosphoglycolate phosphatase